MMKKTSIITLILSVALSCAIPLSACNESSAVPTLSPSKHINVTELSRDEYLHRLAEYENITLEEAAASVPENPSRSYDEVLKFATVDKEAAVIENGTQYTRKVMITACVEYVYNRGLDKVVSIERVFSEHIYIEDVSDASIRFEHGVIDVYQNSTTKYTLTVNGRFIATVPGLSVGIGGTFWRISSELLFESGYASPRLTLQTTITASDLE